MKNGFFFTHWTKNDYIKIKIKLICCFMSSFMNDPLGAMSKGLSTANSAI